MGFNLIYWPPICGNYFLDGSILEKDGKIWKNFCFSMPLWLVWGNAAWAGTAGFRSKGLTSSTNA